MFSPKSKRQQALRIKLETREALGLIRIDGYDDYLLAYTGDYCIAVNRKGATWVSGFDIPEVFSDLEIDGANDGNWKGLGGSSPQFTVTFRNQGNIVSTSAGLTPGTTISSSTSTIFISYSPAYPNKTRGARVRKQKHKEAKGTYWICSG